MVQAGKTHLKQVIEKEVWGVNYERYALGQAISRLVQQHDIKSVCELPAHGAKAAPSLYSIDFALQGVNVILVNGKKDSLKFYKELGVEEKIEIIEIDDISKTDFKNNSFDFVWNFAFIPTYHNKVSLINEMKRISKRFVSIFSVNARNMGFLLHRFSHWRTKIPWTHGDIKFNNSLYVKNILKENGFKNIKIEVVDCPIWPDSPGFRDVRLHKSLTTYDDMQWQVPYIDYLINRKFPLWYKYIYFIERLPMPLFVKHFYAHIFFVLGEK